jgi:multiple sugar transport system permease protein
VLNLVLIALALLILAPFAWLVSNSLQTELTAFTLPPHWFPVSVTLSNYSQVFQLLPFGTEILNSIIVTTTIVIGSLITSSLAAYALARLQFPGRDAIFMVFLSALMIPAQLTIIPVYILMRNLGLVNTLPALILPGLIQVFGIFLLRQHFLAVPRELDDAAKIDGAGHWLILWHVIRPIAGPPLAALAIFTAQQYWNDFFWPNILLNTPDKMTIPVGLVSLQNSHGSGPPLVIFAAITIIVVPLLVLFIFTQRWITEGISFVGVGH